MAVTFDQIKTLFEPYVSEMLKIQVASELGTEPLDLSNYECVKRYHKRILTRLKGQNDEGQKVSQMPPSDWGGPFKTEQIKLYEDWIADGMQDAAE